MKTFSCCQHNHVDAFDRDLRLFVVNDVVKQALDTVKACHMGRTLNMPNLKQVAYAARRAKRQLQADWWYEDNMGHPLATCLGDLRPFHQFTVNISIEKKPKMVGLASLIDC